MAKNFAQYMAENENDAEAALKAAIADVGRRENQNSAARAFKRAYSSLIESLKLPVDVDTDSETEAQTLAARAVEQISNPAPATDGDAAEAQETIDILRELLGEYAERTGIDPDDILSALEALPENATEQQQQDAIAGAFQPLTTLKQDAYEGQLTLMAQAVNKDREALREVLDGKPVELRKVTQDGQETEVWGIAQGDEFKPLTELRSVQLLGSAEPPAPTRPAYPAQVVTGSKPEAKTVETRAAELRGQISI